MVRWQVAIYYFALIKCKIKKTIDVPKLNKGNIYITSNLNAFNRSKSLCAPN